MASPFLPAPDGPFDPQPVLRGDLLHLRPLRPEDLEPLMAVAADPLIWAQHPAKERGTREGFTRFFAESLATGGALVATAADDGRMLGSSRYFEWDAKARSVEIGWTFLARECWGGVFNRELKTLMLRHAFRWAEQVHFVVADENLRSQRAMEKIGGVRTGRREGGGRPPSVVFTLTRQDFATHPAFAVTPVTP